VTTIPSDMHSFCKLSFLQITTSEERKDNNVDQSTKLVAVAREDQESGIQIWDLHNNTIIHTLTHNDSVSKKGEYSSLFFFLTACRFVYGNSVASVGYRFFSSDGRI
jgi:hypothetical protein